MSQPLDACPTCGQRRLMAVCRTTVEYAIGNEGGGQSWDRRWVADDDSTPTSFRCDSCGAEFRRFALDGSGYLVGLGPSPTQAAPNADAMTAEGFLQWLNATVADWCRAEGLTPGGEGEDLGGLSRHLEETDAWDAIGVRLVPAHEDQTLFIVGPGAVWLASTGIELGIEGETIWQDPLSNLRLDVPMADLVRHGERVRRRADEIAALLAGHIGCDAVRAPRYYTCTCLTDYDNDLVVFSKTYPDEPDEDRVRRDCFLWCNDAEGEAVDEEAYQLWEAGLCQPGLVSIVRLG